MKIEWYLKLRQIRLKIKRHIPIWRETCDECGKRVPYLCEDESEAFAVCPGCLGGILGEMWQSVANKLDEKIDQSAAWLELASDKEETEDL